MEKEKLLRQLEVIVKNHEKYNDIETPKIEDYIVAGAINFINSLKDNEPKPFIAGTCSGTIVFEWHNLSEQIILREVEIEYTNNAYETIIDNNFKNISGKYIKF